jgi:hypothetical protein
MAKLFRPDAGLHQTRSAIRQDLTKKVFDANTYDIDLQEYAFANINWETRIDFEGSNSPKQIINAIKQTESIPDETKMLLQDATSLAFRYIASLDSEIQIPASFHSGMIGDFDRMFNCFGVSIPILRMPQNVSLEFYSRFIKPRLPVNPHNLYFGEFSGKLDALSTGLISTTSMHRPNRFLIYTHPLSRINS